MDSVKPWQIILVIVAIGVLGFSLWKYGSKPSVESQLANSLTLVDVQTGQRYIADISGDHTIIIPGRNPDTNEVALIPIFEKDGNWYLWERYRSSIEQVKVSPDAVPNVDGPVKILDTEPIRLK